MRWTVAEAWREVWRRAVAPSLSTAGLLALRAGLLADDPALIQGATTQPPAFDLTREWPAEAACAIGYCGLKGDGLAALEDVEAYFGEVCLAIDERLGEAAGCRWFLNWFDDTPRAEMIAELLPEVLLVLKQRSEEPHGDLPKCG